MPAAAAASRSFHRSRRLRRDGEIDAVGPGQLEEERGPGLAAGAGVGVVVRTDPPVGEGTAQRVVGPGEAAEDFVSADLATRHTGLVRHDEAQIERGAHALERGGDVGHQHRMALGIHDGAVVARTRAGRRPSPETARAACPSSLPQPITRRRGVAESSCGRHARDTIAAYRPSVADPCALPAEPPATVPSLTHGLTRISRAVRYTGHTNQSCWRDWRRLLRAGYEVIPPSSGPRARGNPAVNAMPPEEAPMHPTFRWLERGEGEPIVLLHGLMGRMDHWDSTLQALAPIGRPIAPDVPILDEALGGSERRRPDRARAGVSLGALEIQTAVVGGQLTGRPSGAQLALRAPQRVNGLILTGCPGCSSAASTGACRTRRPPSSCGRRWRRSSTTRRW